MIQSPGSVDKTFFHYGATAMMEVGSDYYVMIKVGSERAHLHP